MEITRASAALLASICVAAGAAGAYFATTTTRSAIPTVSAIGAVAPDAAPAPVEQSEAAVVEPAEPKPVERVERRQPSPAPAPRARKPVAAPSAPVALSPEAAPAAAANVAQTAPEPVIQPEPVRPIDIPAAVQAEPRGPLYDELVVAAESVIGLEVETAVTSERARVEDAVVAHVTRDVRVGNRVAIPAGSKVHGEVSLVDRGGRFQEASRLGVRFTSVALADGTRLAIQTEPIIREGSSPRRESVAKVGGGAIGGAIIGGIFGGAKGAAIGSTVGAGAGTAAVMAGGRNAATLDPGSPVTVRLESPLVVTVER